MDILGPTLVRMEHYGYSDCRVEGPIAAALNGHSVIGLYFSADWCPPCSAFTPVLEKLYTARKAHGAKQLEVVLAS
jgi:thiol-disulfide isomerase/thioredoxin